MFNIYLGIYIIVALVVCAGGAYKIYGIKQSLSALIFFIGSSIAFIIFGVKWFSEEGTFAKTPVSWPTVINTCPDFLTYYKRPDAPTPKIAGETYTIVGDTCIDTVGVSKDGPEHLLKVPDPSKPPNEDTYYFSLKTHRTDNDGRKGELCARAIKYGLTWEGITNGESCISNDGTANVIPSSGCSQVCPTPSGTTGTPVTSGSPGTSGTG